MSTQLTLRVVSKSYGDRRLFDAVSLTVRPGERVGIVGENGAGKSTLLRLLAGFEEPDDGEVVVVAGSLGHLAQTPTLPPHRTVRDAVDRALADLRRLEHELRAAEARLAEVGPAGLARYGDLLTEFELRGGYDADAHVDRAMHALGLTGVGRDRTLGSLSGGELARLGLACLLAARPEVLLLDEPTNHLDAHGLTWLEDQLRGHPGTVVAVSHDRLFLERVATAIVEVDGDRRTLARYGDGYAGYLAEKAAARRRWEQAHRRWTDEVRQLTAYAATTAHRVAPDRPMKDRNKPAYDRDRERVQSSISMRVRNAQERLRRLREDPVPRPPDPLRFAARLSGGTAEPVVAARGILVAGRLRVEELTVGGRDRLLVYGPNGAGKTTLLRVLAGDLTPDRGEVRRRGRIGYLAQEIPVGRPDRSLLSAYAEGRQGDADEHAAALLQLGLFRPDDLRVPVGALSAGQRRRLALARLLSTEVDLLLLDEPTNHLSPALVEELEEALGGFAGAVLAVSHDRRLRRRFAGTQRELRAGHLAR
ncbi:MAG TPA: ABC-F family ATP-binding cassette domain-containing protein [Actinophytocola sp.]|uniref:ribosomal protection-like ABC-F family protein n=1 Tax=Actinophytocola sp. TaxID=1872138 RepID=UPI002DDCA3DE|nr:ABC-F family ATP-binding cassette domain-containing protein [Actinophytocola sp.]HEV2783670.1 ABC-F family ATP-binding cassette domain-containing protein [Actinophytocola sp.]